MEDKTILSSEERISRVEQAPIAMQTMVAKAYLRDDINDNDIQYLFNEDTIEEMNDPCEDSMVENINAEEPEGIGAGEFSVRTSKPSGNKNFMTTGTGGWSTCIKGNPTDPKATVLANCFSGETKYITKEGCKDFYSTVGTIQQVLNERGEFVPAEIKSFGEQQLYKITFTNSKEVYATANHRWVVEKNNHLDNKDYSTREIKTTLELTKSDNIPYNFYKGNNLLDRDGIVHGLVYGDGSKNKNCSTYRLQLFGNKEELQKYVPEHIKSDYNLKEVPSIYESEEYLRGFVAGVLATDGTITEDTFKISSIKEEDLKQIQDICYRIGIRTGGIYYETRDIELGGKLYENHTIYYLTFKRKGIENLLLKEADKNKITKEAKDIRYTHIKSIELTDRYETVYCAVEPITHTITLENNILTGQCVGFSSGRFNEIINDIRGTTGCTYKTLNCNAENWVERAKAAGLKTGSKPRVGAIMCWMKGSTLKSGDGAGHVCIVERINSNGSVYTSESGYGSTAFWNQTRSNSNGRWGMNGNYTFRAFIYLPDDVQKIVDGGNTPSPEPTPTPTPGPDDKFNIGDKVVINGPLYVSADASSPAGSVSNKVTTISRKVKGAHPYNTEGDLGWMDESSITKYEEPAPAPQPEGLKVGDKVKIIGTGNGSSYGTSNTAGGIGWQRQVLQIYEGRPYPIRVGNSTGTTGYYKESALQKL